MLSDLMNIHVWSVDTTTSERDIWILPDAELKRADLYRGDKRAVYVAARVALWQLLTSALGCKQSDIMIDRTCRHCGDRYHGKPTVAGVARDVDFSVSYSTKLALIAIGFSTNVGVDIQKHVAGTHPHRWCFSPYEQRYLTQLDSDKRDAAMTLAWARKEALAKGDGRGLALPLSSIATSGPSSLWTLPPEWQLHDLDVGARFAAAVAYDVPSSRVRFLPWMGGAASSGLN